jgi:hypothetical protein
MPNMTIGELVYKQALENGYDPEKTAGIFSPIQESIKRSLEQYQSLAKDIEIPLKMVNSIAESIRPQLKVLDGIKIPPLPKIPEFPEISMPVSEVLEDYYIKPQDRVHKVEVINPSVFSHTKEESVPVVLSNTRNAVFYIKGDDIYHHEIGRLRYKLRGVNEPKYIKAFKNVIRYMPSDRKVIRITELENIIDKKERIGKNYRMNIGKSARSFNNFLVKNGVRNANPIDKEPVIAATDEYITFHNFIEPV